MSAALPIDLAQALAPVERLVPAIELVGVMAFAFSGFAEARKKDMDVVGVFVIAFVTAFGGGTLRDLLLDRRPFYWVENSEYVVLLLVLTMLITPTMRLAHRLVPNWAFVTADAIGLGFFSIAGMAYALQVGMPWIVAAMMAVITGVFGGLLRDVILNEVPIVLRDGRPYATAAFAGCWIYMGLDWSGVGEVNALWLAALATVLLRMLAWWREWSIAYPRR